MAVSVKFEVLFGGLLSKIPCVCGLYEGPGCLKTPIPSLLIGFDKLAPLQSP